MTVSRFLDAAVEAGLITATGERRRGQPLYRVTKLKEPALKRIREG
jgi:hypothetical protein